MKTRPGKWICFGGLGLATVLTGVNASEWSRWRGPNGTSVSDESLAIAPWSPSGPQVLWTNHAGIGFSSMAISQGRVFTLGNSNDTDTVFCFSTDTGGELWRFSYPSALDPNLYEGGPGSTPTVDETRVYTLGKFGDLICFDAASGTVAWRKNLTSDFGIRQPIWGFAGSPLIEGEKLILNAGGHGLAVNKTNGLVIWLSNTNRGGYSSPVPYDDPDGGRAVVMFSERRAVAARVADGQLLWQHPWSTPFDMNIPDVTVFNGDFLLTSHTRAGTLLDVVGGSAALVWRTNALTTVLSPGVVAGSHLYAFSDDEDTPGEGNLLCLDLASGEVRWSVTLMVGSLISADNKLIILTGDGELILAQADPASYVELARARVLTGRCWTLPALSGGTLYCRNAAGDIVALALAANSDPPPMLQIDRLGGNGRVRLTWPTNAAEFRLETTGGLALDSLWTNAPGSPLIQGAAYVLEADPGGGAGYFRLRKP